MRPNTVKVDRSSRWGNPFVIGEVTDPARLGNGATPALLNAPVHNRTEAVDLFRRWISGPGEIAQQWRASIHLLRGKNLACWCSLDGPCHADVLLELANADSVSEGMHASGSAKRGLAKPIAH
jgi:hypothetical protein